MRNSTLRAITASVAAVAMIVSVGTSPVLARGGAAVMRAESAPAAAVFTEAAVFTQAAVSTRAGVRSPTATTAVTTAAATMAAVTTAAVTTAAPVRQTQFLC